MAMVTTHTRPEAKRRRTVNVIPLATLAAIVTVLSVAAITSLYDSPPILGLYTLALVVPALALIGAILAWKLTRP